MWATHRSAKSTKGGETAHAGGAKYVKFYVSEQKYEVSSC